MASNDEIDTVDEPPYSPTKRSRLEVFGDRSAAEASKVLIAVVFSDDRWNDFGYSILADFGFRSLSGGMVWLTGRLAFRGVNSLRSLVPQLNERSEKRASIHDFGRPFASLLSETKSYSLLTSEILYEEPKNLLAECNDIALLEHEGEPVPDWPDFFSSEVFSQAMIRSSDSYLAYRYGARVLAGERIADEVDVRRPFNVELKGVGPNYTFRFQFSQATLRGRIAVLIGKNGYGKTTALAELASALVDRDSNSAIIDPRPDVNQVLAFAHSRSLSLFRGRKRKTSIRPRVFSLDPLPSKRHQGEPLTRALHDMARGFGDLGSRLHEFQALMADEFPELTLCVPLRSRGWSELEELGNYVPLRAWMRGSEQSKLEDASHLDHTKKIEFVDLQWRERRPSLGQTTFINFVMNVMANAGPGSVVIVDEPENFLHPNLISRFMRVLNQVLGWVDSIAILATHSPFVVREVQSAQVHVLWDGGEGIEVRQPRMQTLGANVSSISNEVFGDDLPQHLFKELLAEVGLKKKSFAEVLSSYKDELSIEVLMLLRAKIKDDEP